jgi:spore germination cell wall hydrolase CwlJ-like protein
MRAVKRQQTIKQVVFAHRQFSWTLDKGKLKEDVTRTKAYDRCWKLAVQSAAEFMNGNTNRGADHYHRFDINPKWNRHMKFVGRTGAHVFYRS